MKRQLERSRLFISAWYIGAGSLKTVFTNKPNQPFSKLKSIYGNELEKFTTQKEHYIIKQSQLTVEERLRIKLKVKQEIKKSNIKIIISLSVTLILFLAMMYGVVKLANYIFNYRLEFKSTTSFNFLYKICFL